jgi:DNA repair exonuclease SbcCD ATPase subunit
MRLSALSIDGFGLFSGRFLCEFSRDVTLIVGDNETGKSTMVAAVGAILFGFANESEKAAFAPLSGVLRSGSLEVEAQGKRYRFTRDFNTNRTKVELLGEKASVLFEGVARPAGRGDEKERYNNLMNRLFGMDSRELFYNSIFVEQGKLPAQMEGVVGRIVSGSPTADYATALASLKETCEQLTVAVRWGKAAARKPRQIELLELDIRNARRTLDENRDAAASVGRLRERLKELDAMALQVEAGIAEKTSLQKNLTAFADVFARKQRVEENLNRCRKEKEELERLERERAGIASEIREDYEEFLEMPDDAEQELSGLSELRRSSEDMQDRRQRSIEAAPTFTLLKSASVAIAAGLILAVLGILIFDGLVAALAVAAGLAAGVYPFVSSAVRLQSERSAHEGKLAEIDNQLGALEGRRRECEQRYPLLAKRTADEILKRLRELQRLRNEQEKKDEALKQHWKREAIESDYHSLSNELFTLSEQLNALRREYPSLGDIEREGKVGRSLEEVKRDMTAAQAELRALAKERDDARYQLAGAEAREFLPEQALEEEIEEKQAQLERLKLHRAAYIRAIDILEEAISEFRSTHLARIQEKAAEYFSAVTGKQWSVCLDEKLEPLYVEHDGKKLSPKQLSRGAQDQLFFSLRLSAINEMCGDIILPVILDDPFVNFDEGRLKAAQRMLDVLAGEHQIILLTHDRRYGEWRTPAMVLEGGGA